MGYIHNDLENLKKSIEDLTGEEVIIMQAMTRRGKKTNRLATIDKTYDTFFRVSFENHQSANYNYSDVLTRDIKVQTFDGENFVPLFVPRPLTKKETIPGLKLENPEHFLKLE